ncbi:hypothetical protein JMA_32690 [Jeotgalibacillus malaysiensis]|uniref:Uncharacterized protein n=1 Tax=Jeotgalibacillus malaysiensis TaxID=1508404 RepID=A0A0B5AR71_9BACL|nr:hypothetical protein JMA_32690 [Jeotgalibacillus malaysiensis]
MTLLKLNIQKENSSVRSLLFFDDYFFKKSMADLISSI